MIKKGTFIEVKIVHYHENKKIADVFLRGSCLKSCEVGEYTEILTTTGHIVKGIVSENNFFYSYLGANSKNTQGILFIKGKR
ncbi:hypothetical protein [Clostridium sp. BJN0013]|uniref:hypothetical protein n=1 Tax=Clostridium sp. BJN0013 TaxID=3236840 RepID=UPI0034C6D78E